MERKGGEKGKGILLTERHGKANKRGDKKAKSSLTLPEKCKRKKKKNKGSNRGREGG